MKEVKVGLGILATVVSSIVMADGRVQGRISAEDRNVSLEGALVRIDELNLETTSSRGGRFAFPVIDAGTYTITVEYLGAATVQRQITVADQDINEDITIGQASGEIEELTVVGQSAAYNSALNRQRAADNIVTVIGSDAIGQLPDTNVSESLQRVPGVSIERDQGEGRYVRVRGMGPDFNNVSINGVSVPSPDSDRRAVALDVIPSDLLESLEVTKAVTPDQDANALGGAIEIKSLSAFDRDGLFYKVAVEGSYNEQQEETSPKLAFTGSNIFSVGDGEDNLGVAFSSSWYKRKFGSDNVETGGEWILDEDEPLLKEMEQRDYVIERERFGLGVNLDFHLNESTSLFLRGLYSKYTDDETRFANIAVYEFEDDDNEDNNVDGLTVGAPGQIYEAARELKQREETQEIKTLSLGGVTMLDAWTFDYNLGWSEATEEEPMHIDGAKFEYDGDDLTGASFSGSEDLRLNAPAGFYDASQYVLDEVEMSTVDTSDETVSLKLDFTRELEIANRPSQLKFGTKLTRRTKESNEEVFELESEDDVFLNDYASGEVDYELGRFGPGIDGAAFNGLLPSLEQERNIEDSALADTSIDEDVNAFYLMGRTDIDNLRIIAGVRYEGTEFTGQGFQYDDESEAVSAVKFENDTDHLLPALHLRYKFTDKTLLRFAWTNTLARPTFEQLNPGISVDGDEAEAGNPFLEALESSNLDISLEHYFGRIGVASVGFFYKDIDNFIYEQELSGTVIGLDGDIDLDTFDNGGAATLTGVELNFSKQFDRLPEPWNGLLVSANATFTDSEATLEFEDGTREISLPNQSDTTANLTLGYENRWLSMRLSGVFKSNYLLEVGDVEDKLEDIYEDDHFQIDFNASANVTDQMQVYFKAININDEPYYTYQHQPSYNSQYEEYGPTFQLGVQYNNL